MVVVVGVNIRAGSVEKEGNTGDGSLAEGTKEDWIWETEEGISLLFC